MNRITVRQPDPAVLLLAILAGSATIAVLIILTLNTTISVRNSAPFGAVKTIDPSRGIAVLSGTVTPNYDNFDAVGLDLRAYGHLDQIGRIDLILSIQDASDGSNVRRVAFSVPADQIPATRSAFSSIQTVVHFGAINASAGHAYAVWLERGPRNEDDIVTLWGIQSFSEVSPADVLDAAINDYGISGDPARTAFLMRTLITAVIVLIGVVVAGMTYLIVPQRFHDGAGPATNRVASDNAGRTVSPAP